MKRFSSRWLPVCLWAAIIFLASANPDPNKSLPPAWMEPCFPSQSFGISCVELLGRFLHLTEYFILTILMARAVLWKKELSILPISRIIVIVMLYALSDEVHQFFVPGRNFQILDLALDFLGTLIGILVFSLRKTSCHP